MSEPIPTHRDLYVCTSLLYICIDHFIRVLSQDYPCGTALSDICIQTFIRVRSHCNASLIIQYK